MTIPKTFDLKSIVDISVHRTPLAAPRATFNELLIVGTTDNISTTERLRVYEAADDMLDDGFDALDPEYIAAQIYFSASPAPRRLWVGRQSLLTSPAETPAAAIAACRDASSSWYYGVCLAAVKADHETIALWAENTTPSTIYAFTTSDSDVIVAAPSPVGIFQYLKNLKYSRTIGQYATTQTNLYPNNIYAMVALIGYCCGQNTGLAGSAFTAKFKNEIGIATEPMTTTVKGYIENQNGNIYASYGDFYSWFEQGVMADGSFLDDRVNLDMLVNNIQLSIADLYNATPKVPQTDGGVTQEIHKCNQALDQAVSVGFLAPGIWRGVNILGLKTGDTLPKGYLVQAQSVADQSDADFSLRKSLPLYISIASAGAIHAITIGIYD